MYRSQSRPSSSPASRICELPLGLLVRGRRERRAVLRGFDGDLQLRLLDLDLKQPRERVVSKALTLCVERIGSVQNPPSEIFDRLILSDRHALVRSLMIGRGHRELTATADCPACMRRQEMMLDLSPIELPRVPDSASAVLSRDDGESKCYLRFPCAVDLEQAHDEDGLLSRCLDCEPAMASPWLAEAEKMLSRYDPLGYVEIVGECPDCRGELRAEFDLVASWLSRLGNDCGMLIEEIHLLASRYHWTEKEILSIPVSRRQTYLDLCWGTATEPVSIEPKIFAAK
jgi:hypothetical protein